MLLTTQIPWKLIDGTSNILRSVVVPAGTYQVERVKNPFGTSDTTWLVIVGTMVGGSEDFFKKMDRAEYGNFRIILEENQYIPLSLPDGGLATA